MNSPGVFLHWGVLQISLANFIVVAVMVTLLLLALILPFPHGKDSSDEPEVPNERR
ncbi:MAG: hypothetical protein M3Y35_06410 [Actinomycetota bacterium]|nr:hypothetical protein [Actinomycetota bacterium]